MTDKIKLKASEEWASSYFGPRCEMYDADCPVCAGWKDYDETGGYVLFDNDELLEMIDDGWRTFGEALRLQDELLNPKRTT